MVLSTFILVQLAVCMVGMLIVYFLHARRLRQEGQLALEAWEQAQSEISATAGDDVHKAWLAERAAALSGEEPVVAVRKLVLEHEQKDGRTLGKFLQPFLAPPGIKDTWAGLRAEHGEQISTLASSSPARARGEIQRFEQYAGIDALLGFKPSPWPALPEGSDSDETSLAEENAALKAELSSVLAGTDEDLRNLLKQFAQDSRDMMGCIQQLEKENQALKNDLARTTQAA